MEIILIRFKGIPEKDVKLTEKKTRHLVCRVKANLGGLVGVTPRVICL